MVSIFGGLEHEWIIFPIMLGIVTPTDELIFFRGVGIPPTIFIIYWRAARRASQQNVSHPILEICCESFFPLGSENCCLKGPNLCRTNSNNFMPFLENRLPKPPNRTYMNHPWHMLPRFSMYGIFTYIWVIFRANVGKYSSTMEHMGFVYCLLFFMRRTRHW